MTIKKIRWGGAWWLPHNNDRKTDRRHDLGIKEIKCDWRYNLVAKELYRDRRYDLAAKENCDLRHDLAGDRKHEFKIYPAP